MKLIYRHYATLYFVFAVDQQESDLGILDLIQGREGIRCEWETDERDEVCTWGIKTRMK